MARIGLNIGRLAQLRRHSKSILAKVDGASARGGRLRRVDSFGANPGALALFEHVPARLAPSPALVVALHGCTQNAQGYDVGSGWSTLADRYGFVVLYPEQQLTNNPRTCFNWFAPQHTARGQGEAESIAQMVRHAIKTHGIAPDKVFVTGLSAGGAMAATMLATYPDLFAGGAIIAGLPHGAAGSVKEAFEAMFQGPSRSADQWGDLVRDASSHRGPWPKVSIWQGSADTTVVPGNADELIKQWTNVHGLPREPSETSVVDGQTRLVWRDRNGAILLESYTIAGMAHGTPLGLTGETALGESGPFLLDVGISSSHHIAKFWGLLGERIEQPRALSTTVSSDRAPPEPAPQRERERSVDPAAVIRKALTAAGLMK